MTAEICPGAPATAGDAVHLIVAGPASHNPELFQEIEALAARLGQALGYADSAAWFDQNRPTLEDRLAAAVTAGATRIIVVPYLLQWRYPDQFTLPDRARIFAQTHPEVTIHLARPIGLIPAVEETLLANACAALSAPPITEMDQAAIQEFAYQAPPGRRLAGAPKYPRLEHHVLVCQGRPCLEAGGIESEQVLRSAIEAAGLDKGPGRIHLTRTRCLGPCPGAGVVAVYPEGDWYHGLGPEQMPDLLATITQQSDALAGQRFRLQADTAPAGAGQNR